MTEQATEALNKAILEGSSVIHRQAERRPFMVLFLKAQLPRDAYVEYLGRLSFVYEALEEADEALKDDPVVGRMFSPELHRRDAIDRDMTFFAGPDWRDKRTLSAATKDYVERIEFCAREQPPAFVSHQWLRYLGNVLAQRVLLGIMERAYGLTDEGTSFYRYDAVDDPRAFLRAYHERMNSMPLTDEQRTAVVEEGSRAFGHQIEFVDELARDLGITGPSAQETERILAELTAEHP